MSSAETVTLRSGEQAVRIECHYTMDNCHREAKAYCNGLYDVVKKGDRSCADCGMTYADDPGNAPSTSSVFEGVLYVRCR